MSKATDYMARIAAAQQGRDAGVTAYQVILSEHPIFSWEIADRVGSGSLPLQQGRAWVLPDGSLKLIGLLPADKVADFVKWLGEVYGD